MDIIPAHHHHTAAAHYPSQLAGGTVPPSQVPSSHTSKRVAATSAAEPPALLSNAGECQAVAACIYMCIPPCCTVHIGIDCVTCHSSAGGALTPELTCSAQLDPAAVHIRNHQPKQTLWEALTQCVKTEGMCTDAVLKTHTHHTPTPHPLCGVTPETKHFWSEPSM